MELLINRFDTVEVRTDIRELNGELTTIILHGFLFFYMRDYKNNVVGIIRKDGIIQRIPYVYYINTSRFVLCEKKIKSIERVNKSILGQSSKQIFNYLP